MYFLLSGMVKQTYNVYPFFSYDHKTLRGNTECGISQLTENADNERKNEAKAQIVTC
jgi:hypothetical protein